MDKKIITKFLMVFAFFILLSGIVSSFAVSSQYWKENPVKLYPGETKEVYIVLQNMVGEGDINVRGVITEGSDIAKIIDESNIYSIPFGEKINVNLRISIPLEAELSGEYKVSISFTTLSFAEGGPLGIGSGVQKDIPVVVIAEPKPEISTWWICLIVAVLVLGALAFWFFKGKKTVKKK